MDDDSADLLTRAFTDPAGAIETGDRPGSTSPPESSESSSSA